MSNIQEEIEDKIIDLIALGAFGRLIVFKSDNPNRDLVVERKGDYKTKTIFLNIYGREFLGEQGLPDEINDLAAAKNLEPAGNFYLIFVKFDMVKREIAENFLVVPSMDMQNTLDEKDFSRYTMSKKDFIAFLIDYLNKK